MQLLPKEYWFLIPAAILPTGLFAILSIFINDNISISFFIHLFSFYFVCYATGKVLSNFHTPPQEVLVVSIYGFTPVIFAGFISLFFILLWENTSYHE